MYTQPDDRHREGFWTGLAILVVGIAIGVLFGRSGASFRGEPELARTHPEGSPEGPRRDDSASPARTVDAESGLEVLEIELSDEALDVLQASADRALLRGLIVQEDGDTVAGFVSLGERRVAADIRIKGDLLDHLGPEKRSLRVELDGDKLFGMSTFSVQAPRTRGDLWEWFVLAVARREGVLAPRATFVDVKINGEARGVYYLEEHFSKELLEAQGRREGPVVAWDESTMWSRTLETHMVGDMSSRLEAPESLEAGVRSDVAGMRAFGEKHLGSTETLARALDRAFGQLRQLRTLLTPREGLEDRGWLVAAMDELETRELGELLDLRSTARAHALASLFQVEHGLHWHNLRFYHDPVSDRLEPVMFDNMVHVMSDRTPVPFRASGLVRGLRSCRPYYDGLFRELGVYCRPDWLDEAFDTLAPELARYEAALESEGPLHPSRTVAGMRQRLRAQQVFLRGLLYPGDPLNWEASYSLDSEGAWPSGSLDVRVWATSETPTVVEGFRFSNGTFVPAADALAEGPGEVSRLRGGGIVLAYDGTPSHFRFPIDERLAGLSSAASLVGSVLAGETPSERLDLDVHVVFRPIAADETLEEALSFRRSDAAWKQEGGRPRPPTVEEALARHRFLERYRETGGLAVRSGTWDVEGDLVVPSGVTLYAGPGTSLRFGEGAVFVTDAPLVFEGSVDEPIVLEPRGETWRGLVVLSAGARSRLAFTTIRATDSVQRSGWITTGGVTFYRSPVTLTDCRFEGTHAEDGLNVFGTDLALERVVFAGCASDSFDGDFVTGSIVDCSFIDGLADGVDLSGSDVSVERCRFLDLADKALSVGEDTSCTIRDVEIARVSIGVAVKDRSDVRLERATIDEAWNFALAVYVKKPEFGPARLEVLDSTLGGSGSEALLAQDGCELVVDGETVPTRAVDVDALYRAGVLGK